MGKLKRLEHDRQNKLADLKKNGDVLGKCSSTNLLEDKERSHDGVFLRPGAVVSSQSPPLNTRLSKRTSVDSGIGVEVNRQNVMRTSKYFKDFQKFSR